MPTPITTVTKTLTYKTPNEQWGNSDSEGKTATATYSGPDKFWVFVDNDTRKISPPFYNSMQDGDSIPVPPGMTRVLLSADIQDDLKIIAMLDRTLFSEPDGYAQTEEELPDGSIYTGFLPLTVTDIYNIDTVTRNFESTSWEFSYRAASVTWNDIMNARNGQLTASDGRVAPDMPESLKAMWIEYRQKLRDFPATMGRGTVAEVDAWKCQLPNPPVE
jgi:hypothetical protein